MNSRTLDKFYTNKNIAEKLVNDLNKIFPINEFSAIIEPSAGGGAFLSFLPPQTIAMDLVPEHPQVIQQDFFTFTSPITTGVLCIGNPPFGKACNLAIKFFNHAAQFSDVIAFILPKTFLKESIQRRLHPQFQLVYQDILPKNSFNIDSVLYDVPTCSQIWKLTSELRTYNTDLKAIDSFLEFVKHPESADIAMRRVGSRSGEIYTEDLDRLNRNTHYFIKLKSPTALDILNRLDFSEIKNKTVAACSISKLEVITLFKRFCTQNKTS